MKSDHSVSKSLFHCAIHDKEAQLCFGAAISCLVLGLVGLTLNSLFAFSTSIDALLVISVFYGFLGTVRVAHFRKENSDAKSFTDASILVSDSQESAREKSAA
ncbi:hypothetical protein [Bythopirellula polymerisocia]|uniref:Uncharacterized protein n=1 Tax=Bythopirellula polymerisocia TaxID=2528003 RepID=A0A5C6CLS9_9BACT|nr:hypothetical protein [Bythopirellula polymerisocia]TWU25853.1 hypothetical protein Pla144_30650 [Bythopirellula polymerisocia]